MKRNGKKKKGEEKEKGLGGERRSSADLDLEETERGMVWKMIEWVEMMVECLREIDFQRMKNQRKRERGRSIINGW